MYVLGIDPGLSGGLCVLNEDGIIDVMRMPTCTRPNRKGNWIDLEKIWDFVDKYAYDWTDYSSDYQSKFDWIKHICIERQFILRSQGMSSGSKTMFQSGMLYGFCQQFDATVNEVNAKDWQTYIFDKVDESRIVKYNYDNDTKLKSIAYVEQTYGSKYLFYSKRQTKPSDGLADAICIASYALYKNKN